MYFQVVGVDISHDMIAHCQQHHQPKTPSMTFQQLDSSQGASFIADNASSFSLVTSFSCLHWVPNMPATVSLFNKVLETGGQFLFVVSGRRIRKKGKTGFSTKMNFPI